MKNLKRIQQLQKELLEDFPDAVIITPTILRELHQEHKATLALINSSMYHMDMRKTDYICYVVPVGSPNTPGTENGCHWCYNGIKYGLEQDYISLPTLPANIFD